ncbi:LytTR family DNA-binding domain-containing protein [Paracrocinitomix mangrovi]|uniref:LytR/AlgR family response regulator transcription factor n=1 Tax=Paracrocinitomix mangrovi TaxID=2862509 RepID=UPI001C8E8A24|nr:LytTR family DNA-binding domain-containing protein [Paracrocinitomix mangrovi]UKN00806.1 LytTR family DNA-binding domain-containing protein [Paracrocinitomix mangrovi]
MNKLRAIIVDDELHCIETLSWHLEKACPEVEIIESCDSPEKGIEAIQKYAPDLLFLDIDMPGMTGFDLLGKLSDRSFEVIFTTAHDQFAVKAIKVSALDYLIKPVDKDELKIAVQKAIEKKQEGQKSVDPIEHLLQQIQQNKLSNRVVFPTMEGLEFVDTNDIVRCESESNYTTVFLKSNNKLVISKTLKDIEELLSQDTFFRVHNSHLVNLNYVKKYVKGDGGHLIMEDGAIVSVSRSRKQELLNYIK